MTQYRVRYCVRGSDYAHKSPNGPHDYRQCAIMERNARFEKDVSIYRCWVEKDYVVTGKILKR